MADPDQVVADFRIAAKYHRLNVPFDSSSKPIVRLQVGSTIGHLEGSKLLHVKRNCRDAENIAILISYDKIIPIAEPNQLKSRKGQADSVTASCRVDLAALK
jgi:hypothetical protein